jgi:hypothetical protein
MRTIGRLVFLVGLLCTSAALAGSQRWLHVVVDEGDGAEAVNLHLPFSALESMWPAVAMSGSISDSMRVGPVDLQGLDLRKAWEQLRTAPDGNFLNMDGSDGQVRVGKSKGAFLVHVDESGGGADDGAKVEVRLPLAVIDALFSGEAGVLDFAAALRALESSDAGDIVRVSDGAESIRIWIDSRQGS